MSEPAKLAKTAGGNTTGNTYQPPTFIVLFDYPYADGDQPAKETFELSRGSVKLVKTRATIELIDLVPVKTWAGVVVAGGHYAIRFDKVKPGKYKLTRSDGQRVPEVIFKETPHEHLTGPDAGRRNEPHSYWTLNDPYVPAKDEDLKSTPPDITALPAPDFVKVT